MLLQVGSKAVSFRVLEVLISRENLVFLKIILDFGANLAIIVDFGANLGLPVLGARIGQGSAQGSRKKTLEA